MQKNNTPVSRPQYVLVVIFLLFAAGIIAGGYLNYQGYSQRFRSEIEKQLSAIADLKVSELVQWRRERMGDGATILKNPAFSALVKRYFTNPDDTEAGEQISAWLDSLKDHYGYAAIRLIDTTGAYRLRLPASTVPLSGHLTGHLADVIRAKEVVFEDFYRNDQDGTICLAVLVPVIDAADNGRVLAVVAMRLDPKQYLYPFLKRWPTPSQTAETLLVRRDSDSALFLNELRFRQDAALKLRIPLKMLNTPAVQAILGHEGIIEGLDYHGVPVIADVRHVPDSPWFMITRIDTEEVFAPIKERQWGMVFFIIALICGAGTSLCFIWWQQRLRFYREQLKTAEALAESRQLLMDITNNSLTLIYIFDTEGRFLLANRKFTDLFGTSPDKLIGRTRLDIMPQEPAVRHRTNDLEVMRNRKLMIFEEENPEADGTHIYLTMKYPLFRSDGTLYAVGGMSTDITERKRTEEALRSSEERFRAIAENTPDAIITTDIKGIIRYCNRTAEKMFAYGQAELLGQYTSILLMEQLCDKEDANRENYLKKTDPALLCVTSQAMAARKGGDTFPIEFPFFSWKAGEETFFTAIIRDITERKRAEEALQQSEAAVRKKLAALLEPEGDIGVLSLADIIDCPALQKIMEDFHRFSNITSAVVDSSGNLLIAVGFQDICMQFHRVHPETSVFCRESDVELAAGQQAGAFKAYRCKNHLWDMATPIVVGGRHMGNFYIGQFFYRNEVPDYEHFRSLARRYGFNENEYLAALDRVPRFDRETVEAAMAFYAKLSAMISSLSYSTVALGRALAQKETAFAGMEKSEQRLNLALDAARMGTFDSDLQSMHLNWSPSHEALWGYRPGEFDGTYEAFARRVHPDDLPDVEAEVNRCIAERALLNKEFRVVWPDGRVHWMMCTGRIIFDAAGAAVNLLGVTMEITERKQMEEALEKQNAELTRFAYSMSHDLKSPLVTIKTFLGYLEKDMQKQDAGCIEKDFTYIHGAADKMGRLLDELLELTRIGRIMNPEVEAPLQDIVQEALVLVAGRIAERGVKIEVTQQPLLLRGDRLRLVEVFQNLIDNAVKFMGDQKEPKIEIGLKIKNGGNLLFVRDNGMGLDPRYQDKLFGLFEKLNPKMEGAGMGLALVKRIVEVHGGRILVESEGLGKGACFWFSLPGRSSES